MKAGVSGSIFWWKCLKYPFEHESNVAFVLWYQMALLWNFNVHLALPCLGPNSSKSEYLSFILYHRNCPLSRQERSPSSSSPFIRLLKCRRRWLSRTIRSSPPIPPSSTPTAPSWWTTRPSTTSADATWTSSGRRTPTSTGWSDRSCPQSRPRWGSTGPSTLTWRSSRRTLSHTQGSISLWSPMHLSSAQRR